MRSYSMGTQRPWRYKPLCVNAINEVTQSPLRTGQESGDEKDWPSLRVYELILHSLVPHS